MSRQLILVRHGETVHNVANISQGWSDSELSERGQAQIARLAERLKAAGAQALYSSPLNRALTTARAVAEATGLEIQTLDGLREMYYGDWEGRSFFDVRKADEAFYHRWIADPDCPCPGGESHNQLRERVYAALTSIADERAIVVSHGTAIRIAATALLNLPVLTSRHFAQDNASINIFEWRRDQRWVLRLWNDTSHCAELKK